ncbi:uncharacterized protein LOC143004052 isoform X2 [Genypterus blacodes]|uniref:uncharacterized protein LOC143004052 isoform X2 n=1 Tax=Genypterus blacodes TaxID=154954 RepID=UPI003F76D19C
MNLSKSEQRDYQMSVAMEGSGAPVPMKKFLVFLSGKTLGAHQRFVGWLEAAGQTQVNSDADCDYVLVFCPVASRVGTDVNDALDRAPAGKPLILVVMHYTNQDRIVGDSRRQVNDQRVLLTVDCLFHDHGLLDCERNDSAITEVHNLLGGSPKFGELDGIKGYVLSHPLWSILFCCVVAVAGRLASSSAPLVSWVWRWCCYFFPPLLPLGRRIKKWWMG